MMTAGTVPILVAAPFLLIWFGVGRASAVCLVDLLRRRDPLSLRAARGAQPRSDLRGFRAHARRDAAPDRRRPPAARHRAGNPRRPPDRARRRLGPRGDLRTAGLAAGIGKVLEVLAGATDPEGIMAMLLLLGLVAHRRRWRACRSRSARFAALESPALKPQGGPAMERRPKHAHDRTRACRARVSPRRRPAGAGRRTMSPSSSPRASSSASSARPAAARARCCRCSRACCRRASGGIVVDGQEIDGPGPGARRGVPEGQRVSLDAGHRQCRIRPQVPRRAASAERRADRPQLPCSMSASRMSSGAWPRELSGGMLKRVAVGDRLRQWRRAC